MPVINFKTNEQNQRDEAIKYVNQAFDNQDNLFIMISNGLKPNNTKDNKVKLDENKIAEIIIATVQPMIDKAFQKVKPMIDESLNIALKPIKKDISDIKKRLSVIEREAIKHGWDISQDKK